jgi:hypothetical protein
VRFNEEVNWPAVFRGFISRESLADPRNPRRHLFIATMLFVETGLQELDDQVVGRSLVRRDRLTWAKITRTTVIGRTKRLYDALIKKPPEDVSEEVLREVKIGEGAFKDRWDGQGAMANYFMCMVRYACAAPRWRRILDRGPQLAMDALPDVRHGRRSLAELIATIATHDLKLWVRLARCWLFPLLLTMDTTLKSVGHQAYCELLDAYSRRWVPVYERGLAQLGVRLRLGFDAVELRK